MNQAQEMKWQAVCELDELQPFLGVRALLGEEQVALFRVKESLYAISAIDPFTKTAVLARGIVGDLKGKIVVASPLYKQHFDLQTGQCLEDETVYVKTYAARVKGGAVELCVQ